MKCPEPQGWAAQASLGFCVTGCRLSTADLGTWCPRVGIRDSAHAQWAPVGWYPSLRFLHLANGLALLTFIHCAFWKIRGKPEMMARTGSLMKPTQLDRSYLTKNFRLRVVYAYIYICIWICCMGDKWNQHRWVFFCPQINKHWFNKYLWHFL